MNERHESRTRANVVSFQIRRMINHAEGKGRTKDKTRRKKVLKMAKGYRGGRSRLYRTAVDAFIGLWLMPIEIEGPGKGILEGCGLRAFKRGGKNSWSLIQPSHGCPEESPCRIGSKDIGRFGGERSGAFFQNCEMAKTSAAGKSILKPCTQEKKLVKEELEKLRDEVITSISRASTEKELSLKSGWGF